MCQTLRTLRRVSIRGRDLDRCCFRSHTHRPRCIGFIWCCGNLTYWDKDLENQMKWLPTRISWWPRWSFVPTEKRDELKKASKIQTSGRDANRAQRKKDEQEARKASAPTDHQLPLCFLIFMEVLAPWNVGKQTNESDFDDFIAGYASVLVNPWEIHPQAWDIMMNMQNICGTCMEMLWHVECTPDQDSFGILLFYTCRARRGVLGNMCFRDACSVAVGCSAIWAVPVQPVLGSKWLQHVDYSRNIVEILTID